MGVPGEKVWLLTLHSMGASFSRCYRSRDALEVMLPLHLHGAKCLYSNVHLRLDEILQLYFLSSIIPDVISNQIK